MTVDTMPQVIYTAITADATLQGLLQDQGTPFRLYSRGSLGRGTTPAAPVTPYAMYGDGGALPADRVFESAPNTAAVAMTFYLYDDTGSFERIKAIHAEIRRVMLALAGTVHPDGIMVTDVRWVSSGSDMYDSVSKNNVKTLTFRVVGRA